MRVRLSAFNQNCPITYIYIYFEGNLTWDDGMHMSWSNWGNHQPQIKRGQNCAYVDNVMKFPKEWSWKMDNNCGSQRSFICKLNKKGNFSSDADQITIHEHLGDPMDCEKGWETHDGSWHCFKPVANKVGYLSTDSQ